MTVSAVHTVTLGTLNVNTGILQAGPTMTRGGRMLSMRQSSSIHLLTAGDGPFLYGICSKSLTLALLEAYLELGGPPTPSAQADVETSSRGALVRTLGVIVPSGDGTQGADFVRDKSLSGLRFTEEAAGWNHWLYNIGQQLTTGATWKVQNQSYVEFNPSG